MQLKSPFPPVSRTDSVLSISPDKELQILNFSSLTSTRLSSAPILPSPDDMELGIHPVPQWKNINSLFAVWILGLQSITCRPVFGLKRSMVAFGAFWAQDFKNWSWRNKNSCQHLWKIQQPCLAVVKLQCPEGSCPAFEGKHFGLEPTGMDGWTQALQSDVAAALVVYSEISVLVLPNSFR